MQIGLDNLVFFPMTDEAAETYGAPIILSEVKSANINPRTSSTAEYADDMQVDEVEALEGVDVTIENTFLPTDVLKLFHGATVDEKGVLIYSATDAPTFGALAFRSKRRDGKYQYQVLYKCKAKLGQDAYKTKGEKVEYQSKTTTLVAMPRKKDTKWRAQAVEGDTNLGTDVITNWFKSPYGETVTP